MANHEPSLYKSLMNDQKNRFDSKIIKDSSGCWHWIGATSSNGYGQFWANGKQVSAHRFAFGLEKIPHGKLVMHKCDNKKCVNPQHLSLGTSTDNNRDTVQKGRHKSSGLCGERVWCSKLNQSKIKKIRAMRGTVSQIEIGKIFGISHSVVGRIQRGEDWSHVEGLESSRTRGIG